MSLCLIVFMSHYLQLYRLWETFLFYERAIYIPQIQAENCAHLYVFNPTENKPMKNKDKVLSSSVCSVSIEQAH